MTRYALVTNARSQREVEAYLPDNYRVLDAVTVPPDSALRTHVAQQGYLIEGTDNHGWTLDSYVLPRMASGLIWGEEIAADHPLVKQAKYGTHTVHIPKG